MKGENGTSNMSCIKFNMETKEIEIKGSESFIESNFDMIEDLLNGSLGVKKTKGSTKTKAHEEPILKVETIALQATDAVIIPEAIDTPETVQATHRDMLEVAQESKIKRPPLRKYFNTLGQLIRSEDTSINKNPVDNDIEDIPDAISIASLKEKFGLPDQLIEGVIRDAERQGRVQKNNDGSYKWV
jgi:hypothetical protein